jgi:hypothetical protein
MVIQKRRSEIGRDRKRNKKRGTSQAHLCRSRARNDRVTAACVGRLDARHRQRWLPPPRPVKDREEHGARTNREQVRNLFLTRIPSVLGLPERLLLAHSLTHAHTLPLSLVTHRSSSLACSDRTPAMPRCSAYCCVLNSERRRDLHAHSHTYRHTQPHTATHSSSSLACSGRTPAMPRCSAYCCVLNSISE